MSQNTASEIVFQKGQEGTYTRKPQMGRVLVALLDRDHTRRPKQRPPHKSVDRIVSTTLLALHEQVNRTSLVFCDAHQTDIGRVIYVRGPTFAYRCRTISFIALFGKFSLTPNAVQSVCSRERVACCSG